jgi:hypothetical protein
MTNTRSRYTLEEAGRRGSELYERDVKPKLRPEDENKFIAIDIDSGEFELDDDDAGAVDKLLARIPDAFPFLGRVGWPAAHRIGGFDLDRPST